ncbi:hypothetical protein ACVVIH_20745 [Chryseobacterium arthrosphaerae]|uniref:hypothetical protein n=1 Tax=Chryseobacterium arthrosphaerae TaxID=651561 RepID=UPI001BAFA410|nr:hypothetical protein [Chryseobacterium arthrosphaerae]QUY56056.1 hypothetical protein I2F65_01440 [Chryseobacterium arthrosphaerae]
MFKKLLVYFKIIDEVQVPVPIKRGSVQKPMKPVKKTEKNVEEKTAPETQSEIITVKRKTGEKRKEIKDFEAHVKDYKEYCLEKTSNQHMMKVSDYKVIDRNDSTETFFIKDDAFITHNEHRMLRIESPYFVKYIQQEYNPITQINENAYD